MAQCILCFDPVEEGHRAPLCPEPCAAILHVPCLVRLLDGGYYRCPTCCVAFAPATLVAAARHAMIGNPERVDRRINLAQSLITAGQPRRALDILKKTKPECPRATQLVDLELARAYNAVAQYPTAKLTAWNQLISLPPGALRASFLLCLADACLSMRQVDQAENATRAVLDLVFVIPYEIAATAMEIIALISKRRGDPELCAKAWEVVCNIADEEERLHRPSSSIHVLFDFLLLHPCLQMVKEGSMEARKSPRATCDGSQWPWS